MGIFSGLEKFGINDDQLDIFADEKEAEELAAAKAKQAHLEAKEQEKESYYLLDKKCKCVVCDHMFTTRAVRSSKLRRLEPDFDLRPRFSYIDTIKYDVISCPFCGYSAMSRYFDHLSTTQMKLIREGVSARFSASSEDVPEIFSYEYAIEKYKLALFCTVTKKGTTSEKAYLCLKIAWLCRGMIDELLASGVPEEVDDIKLWREHETTFYSQAYEGFLKAMANETYPICGMDQNTLDLLVSEMGYRLGKYETTAKILGRLLVSKTASRAVKDRALDLKEEFRAALQQ